jgi:hypothetical protein
MPTAAKLTAAVAFALLALVAADTFVKHLPAGTALGFFREITAAIGFVVGWIVMGALAGHGYREAIGHGIRTSITVVFWALLGFSIYFMIRKSMHMMYDGPMEAVLGIFDLMLEYAKKLVALDMAVVLLGGGALAGLLAEWAGKRWS